MAQPIAPPTPHRVLDVETGEGSARCYVVDPGVDLSPGEAHGTLVLGHGAGKGTNTPDLHGLLALADDGWRVILVDQPWVVAGRRLAPRPPTLDRAWLDIIAALRDTDEIAGRFVQGGRSAGARVACRTAAELQPDAVIALAFPLKPPKSEDKPERWRTAEALAVLDASTPLLVVQGERDAFGGPHDVRALLPGAAIAPVAGGHGFSTHPDDVVAAVREWLTATGR